MNRDKLKKVLAGIGIAGLVAGVGLNNACKKADTGAEPATDDTAVEQKADEAKGSCGKGSCSKGSCGGGKDAQPEADELEADSADDTKTE